MTYTTCNVLVLCTGNSARSIMAEALINTLGAGRFRAYSAGSRPTGRVHPLALEQVTSTGYPIEHLRSKSWDELALPDAPPMDVIITVCGNAAGEACPAWPGHPITVHWGFEDPAAATGSDTEKRAAFAKVFGQIRVRVQKLMCLPLLPKRGEGEGGSGGRGERSPLSVEVPLLSIDRTLLQRQLQAIGDEPA